MINAVPGWSGGGGYNVGVGGLDGEVGGGAGVGVVMLIGPQNSPNWIVVVGLCDCYGGWVGWGVVEYVEGWF